MYESTFLHLGIYLKRKKKTISKWYASQCSHQYYLPLPRNRNNLSVINRWIHKELWCVCVYIVWYIHTMWYIYTHTQQSNTQQPKGFPGSSDGKESACYAGDLNLILGQEDRLEKEVASQSSILAQRIPWTEEPGGPQSMGVAKSQNNWTTNTQP